MVQVITLAFLVVGGSVGVMIPVMLYILDLKSSGWNWQYVSLFISMLASTDAVAIIATMKTSGSFSLCVLPQSSSLVFIQKCVFQLFHSWSPFKFSAQTAVSFVFATRLLS